MIFTHYLRFTFLFVLSIPQLSTAQNITIEDIWARGVFFGENFEGLSFTKDDAYYTYLDYDNNSQKVSLVKAQVKGNDKTVIIPSSELNTSEGTIIPEAYYFSDKQDKILLMTDKTLIYRRSFTASYFIYDVLKKSILPLSSQGKQSYATFSPDGQKVAFVRSNNLFMKELTTGKELQITTDGELNKIINGSTDWVYEEEFEFTKAFFWSPDSKKIAYYKFDEREVKEYTMQLWDDLYPQDYKYKYPKAGEKNAIASIHCYDLASGKTVLIKTGDQQDVYIPRVKWTQSSEVISIHHLNRKQNHLKILHANPSTGESKTVLEEKNNSYVEINDNLVYLKDGKSFILTSETDGYRHIYHYSIDGKLINQVTKGKWEVSDFLGIDEKNNLLYFTSTEVSPLERHLYKIDLSGKQKKQLTKENGTHDISVSPGFTYFIDEHSTADIPPGVQLLDAEGTPISTLQENLNLKQTLKKFNVSKTSYFTFKTDGNLDINASMIKPTDMDQKKKYPVLIYIYGGPGSQNVVQRWKGPDYGWFQMLAQKGYIIVTIDNRGTGGRGADFKKVTQNKLGKLETEDLIAAAKHLGSLPYVDSKRIGIFGWSYGGYMSSLAMTVGADYFKAGIAVAPVISWRFYDSIYTERFLGEPKDNPSGYDDNSPLSHADKLKGAYLLIHGTADDNVHIQNSLMMEKALIKANKQFQVFHYPDRNHGIYGGNTRLHLYHMMTDFLEKNL